MDYRGPNLQKVTQSQNDELPPHLGMPSSMPAGFGMAMYEQQPDMAKSMKVMEE